MKSHQQFKVIIPTFNAGEEWKKFCAALIQNVRPEDVLIIDSGSTDSTIELAETFNFHVHRIPGREFNHGGTRQLGVDMFSEVEIVIFLTQDAILASQDAIQQILSAFDDSQVGAAFGRQLPRPAAAPIEAHARLFNYPEQSAVRELKDRERFGIKTVFFSNSFSAYRRNALKSAGGFPADVILGEDTITAAKMMRLGWKIAYVAEAQAYHSHDYTWRQEFRRYFDIGVMHTRERWMIQEFGGAGNEGMKFVRSELHYLWPRFGWLVPSALIRTACKLVAYRLGNMEANLPKWLKLRLSMHRAFWRSKDTRR